MKIHLVNYEQDLGIDGILTKYAKEMKKALLDLGCKVTVSGKPSKADVNHHINYESYIPSGGVDTVMITHLDTPKKVERVWTALKTSTGICFNHKMVKRLVDEGMPKDKLEYVLSAHDGMPRRPRIVAIATNLYPDGRKREFMFEKMVKSLKDKKSIVFRIMGKDWKRVLDPLLAEGLQVQWVDHFIAGFYEELLKTSDYLLYTGGEDALAQSILDAKNAGLRIIAPAQEELEVEHPFETQEELNEIFKKIGENPVATWTWDKYASDHLKIWKDLYNSSLTERKKK